MDIKRGEGGFVKRAKRTGTDQNHRRVSCCSRMSASDFQSDHDAGELGFGVRGGEAVQQLAGAQGEKAIGRKLRRGVDVADRCREGGMLAGKGVGVCHRMGKDGLLRNDVEEFAGHEGGEFRHAAIPDGNPFRMGARHADQRFTRPGGGEGAEQLRFLTAHHVGRIFIPLRQPRQNADIPHLLRDANRAIKHPRKRCRHVDIAGFNPALSRARHPADENRQAFGRADGVEMRLQDLGKTGPHGRGHALRTSAFCQHRARPAQEPEPETGRAPVDGDESGFGHYRRPPSTIMDCAVMAPDADDARNRHGPERSAATSVRFRHCRAVVAAMPSSVSHSSFCRSVTIMPGSSVLTRIFSGPSRPARLFVNPMIPAFAAA
ncbi:hypothetical protein AT6N2_C1775 [Agrobacterium tumefaciens]|nr:hypothetical protein AT6N2_C1775 [Agrobacterium tumefaciens]